MAAPGIELQKRVRRILNTSENRRLGRARFALLPLALLSSLAVLYGVPSVRADAIEAMEDLTDRIENAPLEFAVSPSEPARELKIALDKPRGASASEQILALLDQELELLSTEIKALRLEAAKVDGSEQVLHVLNEIDSRLHTLASRRERLSQLLTEINLTQPR